MLAKVAAFADRSRHARGTAADVEGGADRLGRAADGWCGAHGGIGGARSAVGATQRRTGSGAGQVSQEFLDQLEATVE